MQINTNVDKPIFQQIREGIEDSILQGYYKEGEQIPSITDLALRYQINPATALKGINILVENNIVYKKRGIGMFVCDGATERLFEDRRNEFFDKYITSLVSEAKRLKLSPDDIKKMIERGFKDEH
ncbi:MAG: GntR family transcriptional regulator [Ruminococcus sp.]|nr:GntR family transcriptional regulator [Ruminococcus sp.]